MDLSTEAGRREWQRRRKKGIGGSEAATLFNRPDRIVNKWQSRFSLYQSKVSEKDHAHWTYEPHVAAKITQQMLHEAGVKVLTKGMAAATPPTAPAGMVQNADHPPTPMIVASLSTSLGA